jgi:hypothetical protein
VSPLSTAELADRLAVGGRVPPVAGSTVEQGCEWEVVGADEAVVECVVTNEGVCAPAMVGEMVARDAY